MSIVFTRMGMNGNNKYLKISLRNGGKLSY